jgi:hypothetical protein
MPNINLSILNQKATPAFFADTLANRPAPSFVGRIFISTDTLDLYRDTGTSWLLLSPSSTGTITGSGAAGQVTYFSGTSSITGNNNLFYDTALSHLGINTNTPGSALDVHDDQSTLVQLNQTIATNDTRIGFQNSGTALWRIGNFYNAGANDWGIFDVVGSAQQFSIKKTTGQTFIGAQTTSSGRLVVNDATGDNHIVVIGATAPSIRINNSGTGATRLIGLGLATGVNNFIQGTTGGELAIFNSSTTASPILFGIYNGTNTQEAARISAARNFIVGSSVDAGYKFDVNGAARVTGIVYADNSIYVGAGIIGTNSNSLQLSSNTTGGEISFWNDKLANRLMTLTGAGSLGIGTSTPDIYSFGGGGKFGTLYNATGYSLLQIISNGTNSSGLTFGNATIRRASIDALNGSDLVFYTNGTNSGTTITERLKILTTGNLVYKGESTNALASAYIENNNSRFGLYSTEGGGTVKDLLLQCGGSVGAGNITLKTTGNLLIGTTTDNGSKLQVNGTTFASGFRTSFLSGIVIPNNTATTIFTITSEAGLYIIYVDLPNGAGSPVNYSAYAIISFDAISARILQQTDGSNLFITLSGNNVQARQTSGNPNDVVYRFIKIV